MGEIQRQEAAANLTAIRDELLKKTPELEKMVDPDRIGGYTDGVMDMYNAFVYTLRLHSEPKEQTDMVVEYSERE